MRFLKPCLQATRYCASCVVTLACWTLWLVLALALALQIHVATSNELNVPAPVLRALEERLALSGVKTTFGRATFDPSGRILLENVAGTLSSFPEPVAFARAVYVRCDPWSLIFLRRFEELEVRVTGVRLLAPAILSPSGRAEELVRNLDATITLSNAFITLSQLNLELANLRVSASGTLPVPQPIDPAVKPPPIPDFFNKNYAAIVRGLLAFTPQLSRFEQPALTITISTGDTGVPVGDFVFDARGAAETAPALQLGPVRLTTRLPLRVDRPLTPLLRLTAESLTVPSIALVARNLRADLRATIEVNPTKFTPRSVELLADHVAVSGIALPSPVLRLTPQPLPRLFAEINTCVAGLPFAARAEIDLKAKSAVANFDALFGDSHLDLLSARIGQNVRRWIDFPKPVTISAAHLVIGPDWKWENLKTRLTVPIINAYRVSLTDGHVALELTPDRWFAPEAFARIGENYARGSYEHLTATHHYRFLLEGRLRPVDISGWFTTWWPDFFKPFLFPEAPPPASVEVAGRWGRNTGGESRVIVSTQTSSADIRTAKFDYARARLFIRPHYLEALELYGLQGPGTLRGTFARRLNPANQEWQSFDFNFTTTEIDLVLAEKIFGTAATDITSPFTFTTPPNLRLSGRLDSATSPSGAHQSIDLAGETATEFRFKGFPVDRLAFAGTLRDDVLTLDRLDLSFAGGTANGRAKVWGTGNERRVGFDYALKDASLGRAIGVLENFFAAKQGAPPPAPNRFLNDKSAITLAIAASAEGAYDDPYSYRGDGSATLTGASLGEVKLLGLLSELFSFTSLRFTAARANFKLNGPALYFSEIGVTGANSAITGTGTYALDRRTLDFNAKIYPFQESEALLKSFVGAVLTPFSNAFEVKLTGQLEKPEWRFAMGPASFLRSFTPAAQKSVIPPLQRPPAPPPAR